MAKQLWQDLCIPSLLVITIGHSLGLVCMNSVHFTFQGFPCVVEILLRWEEGERTVCVCVCLSPFCSSTGEVARRECVCLSPFVQSIKLNH